MDESRCAKLACLPELPSLPKLPSLSRVDVVEGQGVRSSGAISSWTGLLAAVVSHLQMNLMGHNTPQ